MFDFVWGEEGWRLSCKYFISSLMHLKILMIFMYLIINTALSCIWVNINFFGKNLWATKVSHNWMLQSVYSILASNNLFMNNHQDFQKNWLNDTRKILSFYFHSVFERPSSNLNMNFVTFINCTHFFFPSFSTACPCLLLVLNKFTIAFSLSFSLFLSLFWLHFFPFSRK